MSEIIYYAIAFMVFQLLIACGQAPVAQVPHQKQVQIPAEFQPYVTEFEQASLKYAPSPITVDDLIIVRGNAAAVCNPTPGVEILGCCVRNPNATPFIVVDPSVTPDMSNNPAFEKALVFHELGHCVLGLVHDSETMQEAQDGNPALDSAVADSIMNPSVEYVELGATNYYDHYMTQLFNGGN